MEHYVKEFVTIFFLFVRSYAIDTRYMYQSCNKNIQLDTSMQLETSTSLTYPFLVNCSYTVTVPSPKTILVVVSRFEVERKVNGICPDYLNIHDGTDQSSSRLNTEPLCGSNVADNYTSSGSSLTFYFKSDESAVYRGFSLIITAVHPGPCTSGEFSCINGLCIDDNLQCNNYNQCGDNSDETSCQGDTSSTTQSIDNTPLIIGITVGLIVCGGLIGAIILHVYKKNQWKRFINNHLEDPDVWNSSPSYPVTKKYYKHGRGNYNTLNNDNVDEPERSNIQTDSVTRDI